MVKPVLCVRAAVSGSWQNDCAALSVHNNTTNLTEARLRSDLRGSGTNMVLLSEVRQLQNCATLKANSKTKPFLKIKFILISAYLFPREAKFKKPDAISDG